MTADAPEKRGSAYLMTLRGYFIGLPVEAVVKVVLHHPSSLDLTQIHGTLRAFSGRFSMRSAEDGTEILYHVEADPGIPMLTDDAARQFLVQHVERLLDRIKLAAERKAPSRRPRAAAPRTAAGPAATVAEADDEEGAEGAEAVLSAEGAVRPEAPRGGPDTPAAPPLPAPLPSTGETSREKTALAGPAEVGRAPAGPDEVREHGARPEGAPPSRRRRRRRRRRHHGPPAPGLGGAPSGSPGT